jgi:hypothetical protein
MATYKYQADISHSNSDAFDATYRPGATAPYSGVYRCKGCGREVASNQGQPLPPQNNHQHTSSQGDILWRLTVYADHNPK